MSKIGKEPVNIKEVKVKFEKGVIFCEGPKGKVQLTIPAGINIEIKADVLTVTRVDDVKFTKSLHGTIRALIYNMVEGVKNGYVRELDIVGVGYKAQMSGKSLSLSVGFAHPVDLPVPAQLKVTVPKPTHIVVEGPDKQLVGQFSAKIREVSPPEPYKGKGIRYTGEEVRKKLGKALAK